ncbi:MAG: SpoIVB peptidase [Oscillospiraceae bacterium]|nr:SpoIVB peptidase [Oscillospiraceae bacterium]
MKRRVNHFRIIPLILAFVLIFTPVLSASAHDALPRLIPVGKAIGLKLSTDGALIIGLNNIENGNKSPALDAGLRTGDIITDIGAEHIDSVEECRDIIADAAGSQITVRVTRSGEKMQFEVTPGKASDGHGELGVWLRDGIAGIGTVTFVNPANGQFGALGHSVSDSETGTLLPIKEGTIMPAEVTTVVKGEAGAPGQLQANFDPLTVLGNLLTNCDFGVFGTLKPDNALSVGQTVETASRSEIKTGPATVRVNVTGGEVRDYEIEVTRVYPSGEDRDMLLTVTDPELIAITGGIVQGMSGAPILQNGKLIGAVTHVLVSEPLKGYGVSIERMLGSNNSYFK